MTSVAVGTNVLARLATGDSPDEHAKAVHLLATHAVFVPVSVTLELEWVLRSRYRYSAEQFIAFTRWLMQQAGVEFGESKAVHGALNLHEAGLTSRMRCICCSVVAGPWQVSIVRWCGARLASGFQCVRLLPRFRDRHHG